jgi:8-oxo-dGTP pyrophosphatase MutT (NUDIX family)
MHRLSCILLVDGHGRILLQERDEHAGIDPERWGLVGGHVEDGEEFEPAAYRELAEETGIEMEAGALDLWRELRVSDETHAGEATFRIWCARVDLTDADIVLGEGRQIVFVDPDRVAELDLADFPRRVVSDFLTSEEYRELWR